MADTFRGPVDYDRTTPSHAGESLGNAWRAPGLLLVAVGVAAFVMCLAAFALGQAGAGVGAVVVALLSVGAGLAWLTMEGRRVRQIERDRVDQHPNEIR